MDLKINDSDARILDLVDEFLAETILYLRMMDIDHFNYWKNDFLNENHNYLRLISDRLQKIDGQISKLSDKFRSGFPEFIESMHKFTRESFVLSLDAAGLRSFKTQHIPEIVKSLKSVYPDSHIAWQQMSK